MDEWDSCVEIGWASQTPFTFQSGTVTGNKADRQSLRPEQLRNFTGCLHAKSSGQKWIKDEPLDKHVAKKQVPLHC